MAALEGGLDLGPAVVDRVAAGDSPVVDEPDDHEQQDEDPNDDQNENQGMRNLSRGSPKLKSDFLSRNK
jgi:hypothetical protein